MVCLSCENRGLRGRLTTTVGYVAGQDGHADFRTNRLISGQASRMRMTA
jgi:hypothetical protein